MALAEVKPYVARPNADVVRILEGALERARKGETTGIVLVEQEITACTSYSHANIAERYKVIGYLSHCIFKLHEAP